MLFCLARYTYHPNSKGNLGSIKLRFQLRLRRNPLTTPFIEGANIKYNFIC